MSSLPDDLYRDILVRVPAESLLACKCVCKNWYALISSSDFVRSHIHLTAQKNNPILLLDGLSRDIRSVNYSLGNDSLVCEIENMYYPFNHLDYHVKLLNSCNGIVCIHLYEGNGDVDFLCLWNPLTREFKKIPETPNEFKDYCNLDIRSLSYDHKNDDYKLVFGVAPGGCMGGISALVQVYTLSSNSWKTKKTIPYSWFHEQKHEVLVNGNLHWLVMVKPNFVLLSLDISDEIFKEMQLPDGVNNNDLCTVLGVLEGCLCALVSSYDDNDVRIGYEVWEMQDYGVQESWIKRCVISHDSIISEEHNFVRIVRSWKNGDILLLSFESLVLYDPKHGSARELKINDTFFGVVNYFQSLVSLNSGTYVRTEIDSEESNRKLKKKKL